MSTCNDSYSVTYYWESNETFLGPSTKKTLGCAPPEWAPLLILAVLCWLCTFVVFIISAGKFEEYRWTKIFKFSLTRRITFYYVAYSFLNVITIMNARGAHVYSYVNDVIEALVFVNFYMLMWSYVGEGCVPKTFTQLIGLEVSLASPPLCCLKCAPLKTITKGYLKLMERLLLQLPFTQFAIGILKLSLVLNGVSRVMGENWATTLFDVILTLSAVVSIYAISTLYSMWAQFIVGKKVAQKFLVFKLTIVLAKLQDAVLGFVYGAVDSYGYYSGEDRTIMWGAFIVTVECLILMLIANFLYVKADFDDVGDVEKAAVRFSSNDNDVSVDERIKEKPMEDIDLGEPALVIKNPNI